MPTYNTGNLTKVIYNGINCTKVFYTKDGTTTTVFNFALFPTGHFQWYNTSYRLETYKIYTFNGVGNFRRSITGR